jgi:hypothetical protein
MGSFGGIPVPSDAKAENNGGGTFGGIPVNTGDTGDADLSAKLKLGSPRKTLTGRDPRDPRNPKSPYYKTPGEQAGGLVTGTLDVAAPALALAGGAGAGRTLAAGGLKAAGPMAVKAARDLATAYIAGEGVSRGLKAIGVNGVLANIGGLLAGMGAAGTLEEILGKQTLDKLAVKAYEERFGVPPKTAGDKLRARGLAQAEVAKAKAEGMPPKAPRLLTAKAQAEEAERQKAVKIAESAERIRAEQGPPKRFDAAGVKPADIPTVETEQHAVSRRSPLVPAARTPVRELSPKERLAKRVPFYEREGAQTADIPEAEAQRHAAVATKLGKLFREGDKPERPVQPPETTQPAPGMVRLYRGQPGEHSAVSANGEPGRPGTQFTTDKKFAELYSGGKPLMYVDVPESVVNTTEAKAAPGTVTADVWGRQAGRVLPPEYANQAKRLGIEKPDVTSISPAKTAQETYRETGLGGKIEVSAVKKNINLWRLAQSKGMTPDQVRALPDAELDALIAEAGYSPVKSTQGELRTAISSDHDKLRDRVAQIGEAEQKPGARFSPTAFSKIERVRSKRRTARQSEQ